MMRHRWGLDRNVLLHPKNPQGVKQYHWNTGAKETTSWNPNNQATDKTKSSLNQPKQINKLYVGPIIESDARPTGVQLKKEAKLSTLIGLITKHADCRITLILYPIRL